MAYDIDTRLIQQKVSKQVPRLSLFKQSALRNIIATAVRTEQKLFKAQCAPSPVCPWCSLGVEETAEHLFWNCQQWQELRTSFQETYEDIIPLLPPITKNCGLFPRALIDNQVIILADSKSMVLELQRMFINILKKRDALKAKSLPRRIKLDSCQSAVDCQPEGTFENRAVLFSSYPWDPDHQDIFHSGCFGGTVPNNWRVYRKGSEWSFGIPIFKPFVWCWRNLRWADPSEDSPSITWLELALDFRAATHCSLGKPGVNQETAPAGQIALSFAQASKRMATICKSSVSFLVLCCCVRPSSLLSALVAQLVWRRGPNSCAHSLFTLACFSH